MRVSTIDMLRRDAWVPEPLFVGKTVILLGGGPSLAKVDVAALQDRPTIAINAAGRLAPWALLFFRDLRFYWDNKALIEQWAGLVVTASHGAGPLALNAKVVHATHMPDFPPCGWGAIRAGRTSGHLGLSLAIAMGAQRVVMLGFDCRFVDGRSHWHDDYPVKNGLLYERDFLPSWEGWGAATERAGVSVVNATEGSAIDEFPICTLDEILLA